MIVIVIISYFIFPSIDREKNDLKVILNKKLNSKFSKSSL